MEHLGGHNNKSNIEKGSIEYLIHEFNIKTIIDVGCGIGDSIGIFKSLGLDAIGVEGDIDAIKQSKNKDYIIQHDFTKGKFQSNKLYDLGYSTEFLEHVDEKCMDNYMSLFQQCRYVLYTAAPTNWTGIHHVNCQEHKYWLKKFNGYGFICDPYITLQCREKSSMNNTRPNKKQFMKHRGIFMINTKFLSRKIDLQKIDKLNSSVDIKDIKRDIYYQSDNYIDVKYEKMDVKLETVPNIIFKSTIPFISYLN